MNYEDVQKVSNAAKAKSNLVSTNFFKYFIRAIMAGFFIDVAMIYSNVVGNVFSKTMPEWGKFMGALVFSIAVLLISFGRAQKTRKISAGVQSMSESKADFFIQIQLLYPAILLHIR